MLSVELDYLYIFAKLVNVDENLGLKIEIKRCNLTFSEFDVVIKGIKFRVKDDGEVKFSDKAVVHVTVPPGYPLQANPNFRFLQPVPFHPHVYTNGEICFGDLKVMIDFTLVDWLLLIFEILSFSSENSIFRLSSSRANSEAYGWLSRNRTRYNLNIRRLRNLAERAKKVG